MDQINNRARGGFMIYLSSFVVLSFLSDDVYVHYLICKVNIYIHFLNA